MEKLNIAQAAVHLGLSQDTVRRRLRTGDLPGERVKAAGGFRWLVEVSPMGDNGQATPPVQEAHADGAISPVELVLRERLAAQENELEARRQEIRELHQLLAARALSDGHKRFWWQFWR